jgi:hypothetical protein
MSGALGGVQNPFAFSTASVGYYLRLIVVNNLALLFAAAVLAWVFVRKRVSGCGHWLYLFGSIALFNLALFIPASHHEGRYMLPTILMLALGTGVALVRYFTDSALRSRRVTLILLTLLGWYFLFHTVHIARWMVVWSAGPPEKAMVEEALRLQVPGKPVLLIQSYLAGHPHTKDAYHAYATLTGKTEVNLYRAIFAATPKPSVPLLEVRYVQPPAFSRDPRVLAAFDHAILMFEPRPGELNQFDYMDEDVLRLWYYGELMPRYTVVK